LSILDKIHAGAGCGLFLVFLAHLLFLAFPALNHVCRVRRRSQSCILCTSKDNPAAGCSSTLMRYFQTNRDSRSGGGMDYPERFRRISVATLLSAPALPAPTLNAPSAADPSVGTWQAQFQSKTFPTLTLTMLNNQLSGTVSRASVQIDKDGELATA